MISIQTYLYNQTVDVQILESEIFTVRNRAVYVRPIKLYQGIDNPVVVKIKNQDQKKRSKNKDLKKRSKNKIQSRKSKTQDPKKTM